MAVTINDVAKLAGVSHTTVSWVIHDDPRITSTTKEKVWKAVKELDYHPNIYARNLVQGKSNTIALVAAEFSTSFENRFLRGVETTFAGKTSPYSVQLYSLMGNIDSKEQIIRDILRGHRAEVVILLNLELSDKMRKEFDGMKVPLILVEEEAEGVHVVKMDSIKGSRLAVNHLTAQGKENIALVVGDPSDPGSGISPSESIEGFRLALEEHSLPFRQEAVITVRNYLFSNGQAVYGRIKEACPRTDAVFCAAGDELAMGILAAAIRDGRHVPEELAVMGYDNLEVSSLIQPPLSSIDQPIEEMGRFVMETAVKAMEEEKLTPRRKVYSPRLVVRSST